ncbi:MAG: hypothetical protein US50_C0060G0002, partial [Candidatus Nomurabacteria bacterium GW2011_GWB1_37_5]
MIPPDALLYLVGSQSQKEAFTNWLLDDSFFKSGLREAGINPFDWVKKHIISAEDVILLDREGKTLKDISPIPEYLHLQTVSQVQVNPSESGQIGIFAPILNFFMPPGEQKLEREAPSSEKEMYADFYRLAVENVINLSLADRKITADEVIARLQADPGQYSEYSKMLQALREHSPDRYDEILNNLHEALKLDVPYFRRSWFERGRFFVRNLFANNSDTNKELTSQQRERRQLLQQAISKLSLPQQLSLSRLSNLRYMDGMHKIRQVLNNIYLKINIKTAGIVKTVIDNTFDPNSDCPLASIPKIVLAEDGTGCNSAQQAYQTLKMSLQAPLETVSNFLEAYSGNGMLSENIQTALRSLALHIRHEDIDTLAQELSRRDIQLQQTITDELLSALTTKYPLALLVEAKKVFGIDKIIQALHEGVESVKALFNNLSIDALGDTQKYLDNFIRYQFPDVPRRSIVEVILNAADTVERRYGKEDIQNQKPQVQIQTYPADSISGVPGRIIIKDDGEGIPLDIGYSKLDVPGSGANAGQYGTTGKFGVGFLSALFYALDPNSRVVIRTNTGVSGQSFRYEYSLNNDTKEIEKGIIELSHEEMQRIGQGSEIEIISTRLTDNEIHQIMAYVTEIIRADTRVSYLHINTNNSPVLLNPISSYESLFEVPIEAVLPEKSSNVPALAVRRYQGDKYLPEGILRTETTVQIAINGKLGFGSLEVETPGNPEEIILDFHKDVIGYAHERGMYQVIPETMNSILALVSQLKSQIDSKSLNTSVNNLQNTLSVLSILAEVSDVFREQAKVQIINPMTEIKNAVWSLTFNYCQDIPVLVDDNQLTDAIDQTKQPVLFLSKKLSSYSNIPEQYLDYLVNRKVFYLPLKSTFKNGPMIVSKNNPMVIDAKLQPALSDPDKAGYVLASLDAVLDANKAENRRFINAPISESEIPEKVIIGLEEDEIAAIPKPAADDYWGMREYSDKLAKIREDIFAEFYEKLYQNSLQLQNPEERRKYILAIHYGMEGDYKVAENVKSYPSLRHQLRLVENVIRQLKFDMQQEKFIGPPISAEAQLLFVEIRNKQKRKPYGWLYTFDETFEEYFINPNIGENVKDEIIIQLILEVINAFYRRNDSFYSFDHIRGYPTVLSEYILPMADRINSWNRRNNIHYTNISAAALADYVMENIPGESLSVDVMLKKEFPKQTMIDSLGLSNWELSWAYNVMLVRVIGYRQIPPHDLTALQKAHQDIIAVFHQWFDGLDRNQTDEKMKTMKLNDVDLRNEKIANDTILKNLSVPGYYHPEISAAIHYLFSDTHSDTLRN